MSAIGLAIGFALFEWCLLEWGPMTDWGSTHRRCFVFFGLGLPDGLGLLVASR